MGGWVYINTECPRQVAKFDSRACMRTRVGK
jgi:hypothetical protein